jgi:hypothetical protein
MSLTKTRDGLDRPVWHYVKALWFPSLAFIGLGCFLTAWLGWQAVFTTCVAYTAISLLWAVARGARRPFLCFSLLALGVCAILALVYCATSQG